MIAQRPFRTSETAATVDRGAPPPRHFQGGGARLRWLINGGYAALLVTAATLPPSFAGAAPSPPDWLAHAVAYGIQAGLVFWAAGPSHPLARRGAIGITGAVVFGLFTEGLQMLASTRSAEVADLAANAAGAVVVIAVVATGLRFTGRHRP